MRSKEVYDFVIEWLTERKIEKYYKGNKAYLKMKETDLIDFSIKLVKLMESNTQNQSTCFFLCVKV